MIKKTIKMTNPTGLNAKAAALLVQTAGKFTSKIWIAKDDKLVDAKSIMGLMSLTVPMGSEISVEADGEDEQLAIKRLIELIESGFEE
ncbi:MAG TPA: HPr family phosphocarrier protein [Clostridiaceae bacterium]|nr:HPr family phosphocarrier protein [Clostridiaceae bacterium]